MDDIKTLKGTNPELNFIGEEANGKKFGIGELNGKLIFRDKTNNVIIGYYDPATGQWSFGGPLFKLSTVLNLSQASVAIPSGDSLTLHRETLTDDKKIKIIQAKIAQSDGTTETSNLILEVYNNTDSTSIYSTTGINAGSLENPLAEGGKNDEIIIRLKNDTAGELTAQGLLNAVIE